MDVSSHDPLAESPRDLQGCVDAVASKPQYELLTGKLHLGKEPYPRSYLSSTVRPDQKEIELLKALHGDLQECRKIALDAPLIQPSERKALVESYAADDRAFAEATTGRLTWGKLNEGLKSGAARRQSRLALAHVGREPEGRVSSMVPTLSGSSTDANAAPLSKRSKAIDIDYDRKPDLTLPEWANRHRERTPTGIFITTGNRSIYCDNFRHTKYCGY